MCYETSQLTEKIYREAIRLGADLDEIDRLKIKWDQLKAEHPGYYHTSGFSHPKLAILFLENKKIDIKLSSWGLIPRWIKDEASAQNISNKTINARGETLFDKASFKLAAKMGRCILPMDGFFEHQYKNGKVYPYYISHSNEKRLFIGGITDQWINKNTGEIIESFSIVTTPGNKLLSEIHNNPKLEGPRMPLILNQEDSEQWFNGNQDEIKELIKPNNKIDLKSHTVQKLKGSKYCGNHQAVQEHFHYQELNSSPDLFDN